MITGWNGVEHTARSLLMWQCNHPNVAALTSEMTSTAMRDALLAIAKVIPREEVSEHLQHFAKALDLAREHRNYYAHGVKAVVFMPELQKHVGVVQHYTARQNLAEDFDIATAENLATIAKHCFELSAYGLAIMSRYGRGGSTKAARKAWPSWPEKPTPLWRLLKSRRTEARRPRRRRASRA